MCECSKRDFIDFDKFSWKEFEIVSKQFTFRELLSESLTSFIKDQDLLDTPITFFENVPCTGIYSLATENLQQPYAFIFIGIGTNMIDTFECNDIEYDFAIKYKIDGKRDYGMQINENKTKKFICFSQKEFDKAHTVNQELLDSIRVKCDGKIVDKDGFIYQNHQIY